MFFSTHASYIVSKAKLRSNQILRCFHRKDRDILSKAFVLYVRPIIESELLVCSLLFRRFISHTCHHDKSHFTLYSFGIPRDRFSGSWKTSNGDRRCYFDCLLVPFHNLCNSVARDEHGMQRRDFPGKAQIPLKF